MRLFSALASGVIAICAFASQPALAEKPGKGVGSCKSLPQEDEWPTQTAFLGGGVSDYARLTLERTICKDKNKNTVVFKRFGLRNDKRDILVPALYDKAVPYSRTAAFVLREDGKWATYRFGKGEERIAPLHPDVQVFHAHEEKCQRNTRWNEWRPVVVASLGPVDAKGYRDAAIYFGDNPPVVLSGLGGSGVDKPIERYGDMLIARWRDETGVERTRLHSVAGRPLSPVLGELTRWATESTIEGRQKAPVCYGTDAVNLFAVGPVLDENPQDLFVGHLLTPLGNDGQPVALPEGSIGVFPVPAWPYALAKVPTSGLFPPYRLTRMWAVAYPSRDGFEFTLAPGSLADAIAASPGAPRYKSIGRGNWPVDVVDLWTARNAIVLHQNASDGKWQGRGYLRFGAVGEPAPDMNGAFRNAVAANNSAIDAEYTAYVAEKARADKATRIRYDASLADGSACRFVPPWNLGKSVVERHAKLCPQQYNVEDRNRLSGDGYPADVIAAVNSYHLAAYAREAAYRAEQAELARTYVPPGAWQTALRIAGDQAVANIRQSGTNWLEQRRAQHNADWQRSQRAY